MSWLKDDLSSTSRPTIVFLHEPTVDIINRDELLGVLKAHDAKMIFSGHWHVNDLLNSSEIPEQVTTAVSGAWWLGTDITGVPGGYMVVAFNGSRVDTFYRCTGMLRQINVIEPAEPEVSGNLKIKAQIWSSVPMVRAWVSIDKGERRKMNLTWQGLWYEAQTSIDIQTLPRGYHTAKITAIDDTSVFSKSFSFKVTEDASTPIGDLLSHPQTYLGKHPRIEGYLDYIETNLSNLELGDLPVFCDDTGKIPFALEYCPPLPQQENKTKWTATGQFQNYKNRTFSVFLLQRDDTCPEKVSL
jgi:hypothetical protein